MIDRLLHPRSIAVIGASRDPAKRGHQVLRRLLDDGYEGAIYPVNPAVDEIAGLPVYRSLDDVPGPVDLALIVRPAEHVPAALEECGRNQVTGAVVLAVGFGESGEEGQRLEDRIVEQARRYGVRLIGPNTSGLFNLHCAVNLVGVADVPVGGIGVISQSGNVILGLIQDAARSSVGFSTYVGVGNESDIRYHELLAHLREDPNTEVVAVYAEGFKDGRAFLREVRRTVPDTPVVIYKAGRTEVGTRSASSHTGALAGDFRVAEAALRQAGAVSVRRSDELLPVAETLAAVPPIRGRRIAVLADGGGHATMAADGLAQQGLELPTLTPHTQRLLQDLLPRAASLSNPVDVAGGADRDPGVFAALVRILLRDPGVDGVLVVGLFGGYALRFSPEFQDLEAKAAGEIVEHVVREGKPVIVQTIYAPRPTPALETLRAGGVPVHQSIDIAVRCLTAAVERHDFLAAYDQRSTFEGDGPATTPAGDRVLSEPEARRFLAAGGVKFPPWWLVTTAEEAAAAAVEAGGPIALKIVAGGVTHKTDAGGVELNVAPEDVAEAYERLTATVAARVPDARIEGVVVVPMERPGVELLVGAIRDRTFGPMVAVGLGGILVGAADRLVFRAAPLTPFEAGEALDELGGGLVDGFRGGPSHRAEIIELLITVADLLVANPQVQQVDLNPVILGPDGAVPVDARVVMADEA